MLQTGDHFRLRMDDHELQHFQLIFLSLQLHWKMHYALKCAEASALAGKKKQALRWSSFESVEEQSSVDGRMQ
jgi:hypothetical protein